MNHYGIAREAATIYNLPLAPLLETPKNTVILSAAKDPCISSEAQQTSTPQAFPVTIEAKDLCGRFTAQVLRNITIAPSTGQVAEYFTLLNQKQISNAVDASNFVLLGMGHPTHAFDLDKLEGGIIVRLAHKGEKLKLLDGTERILEPDDLVVADEKESPSPRRSHGRLGLHDHPRNQKHPRRSRLVRSVSIRPRPAATASTPTPPTASSAEPTSTPPPSPTPSSRNSSSNTAATQTAPSSTSSSPRSPPAPPHVPPSNSPSSKSAVTSAPPSMTPPPNPPSHPTSFTNTSPPSAAP